MTITLDVRALAITAAVGLLALAVLSGRCGCRAALGCLTGLVLLGVGTFLLLVSWG